MAAHERIGGSRAQRDLIEYALVVSQLRAGRMAEARQLLQTRRLAGRTGLADPRHLILPLPACGERVGVRGSDTLHRWRMRPPLTLTLSP